MRIIAGKYKGRIIKAPHAGKVRPTSDMVRAALFSIIGARVNDAYVLDLFSGSGALGIEAISRGAKEVIFVENDKKTADVIKNNLAGLGIAEGFKIMATDAGKAVCALKKGGSAFDIVLLDPPYHNLEGLKKILLDISGYDILNPHGLVILEHFKKDVLEDKVGNLSRSRIACYGDALLSFYEVYK